MPQDISSNHVIIIVSQKLARSSIAVAEAMWQGEGKVSLVWTARPGAVCLSPQSVAYSRRIQFVLRVY